MIDLLKDKHTGKSASIIGSGPSAGLYNGSSDISIGVNGAAFMDEHFDYFLCGDHNSHKFDWFRIKCSDHRVIAKITATNDYQLYPKEFDSCIERRSLPAHKQRQFGNSICPIYPHYSFNYRWYKKGRLSKNNNFLMFGGTISCCAVQLAYMMGCTEVNLYGCDFKHNKDNHYFYDNKQKIGRVNRTQRETMELCLKEVTSFGIKVHIHGNSALKID